MRWWFALCGTMVVVGLAAAQDENSKTKPAAKAQKKADDSLDLDLVDPAAPKKAGADKDVIAKVSYGIGLQFGKQFKQSGLLPDLKKLMQGIQDSLEEKEPELTDDELQTAFKAFEPIARKAAADQAKIAAEKAKVAGEKNLKAGEEFLEANKDKEGVKTLPSGLQYKVLAAGKGKSPKATDTVRVHYRGKLIDGKMFDESYKGARPTPQDEPAEFQVNGVIKGWTEALQKMKVGDRWQLFIPSEIAYRDRQTGPLIGPHSVLVFEVELLAIVEQP